MSAGWGRMNTDPAPAYHGWWHILNGMAKPGAPVTVCSRSIDHLDIFVVNTNGVVCTAWWAEGQTWGGWVELLSGTKFQSGGWIDVAVRSTDKMDIFGVANNGATMTAAWEKDGRPWRGFWQIVRGLAFSTGTRLSVAVRSPDFLDVFVIGVEHQIWTAAWQPSFSDWFHGWSNVGNFTVLIP